MKHLGGWYSLVCKINFLHMSITNLELRMNGCCDVVSLSVSRVVDVFDHGIHIHITSFKNSP